RAVRIDRARPDSPWRSQGRQGSMNDMGAVLESINTGVPPATYGEGERPPRGDYARARADYTCEQRHDAYTAVDHAVYRRLHERQSRQLEGLTCREFIDAVA